MKRIFAVIPAAGKGTRFDAPILKQYADIGDKTVIEHAIDKLLTVDQIEQIVVSLAKDDSEFSKLPIAKHPKVKAVVGGSSRAESVLCGLIYLRETYLNESSWTLVHDAARPCLRVTDLQKLIQTVTESNIGGILATKITDTIKKVAAHQDQLIEQTYDRELLWAAATPQMFDTHLLAAHLSNGIKKGYPITDEASAVELAGEPVQLIECHRDNIKITKNEDLELARHLFIK